MIQIGKCLLEPSYWREPHYTGGLFPRSVPALYCWACVSCQSDISLVLSDFNVLDSLELSQHDKQIVNERFEIGVVGRSKDGGWPCLQSVVCPNCDQEHLVYLGVQEPSNSMFIITVQAICELNGT